MYFIYDFFVVVTVDAVVVVADADAVRRETRKSGSP